MSKEKQIEEKSCKKCLHYEMCLDNFRKAKERGFYELTEEDEYFTHADECDFCAIGYHKQSEWISVDERLPDKFGKYLTYGKSYCTSNVSILNYDTNRGVWYFFDNEWGDCEVNDVTHWMPLPEAPKGGEE